MKFQNPNLNFVQTHGQAQTNMPFNFSQSWGVGGIKKHKRTTG